MPTTSARRAEYQAYLRTPEWQARRQVALAAALNRCQVCNGAERLDVHHRTYERIFNELPTDLTVLCRNCHSLYHGKATPAARKPPRKKKPRGPRNPRPKNGRKLEALNKVKAVIEAAPPTSTTYTTQEVADLAGITANQAGMALNWCHEDPDVRCRRAGAGKWRLRRIQV